MRTFWILLFIAMASLASGCSSQTVVVGNLTSMLVAFGLFYTTINLKKK